MNQPLESTFLEAVERLLGGKPDEIVKFVLRVTLRTKAQVEKRHGIRLPRADTYLGDAWAELCSVHKKGPLTGQPKLFTFDSERGIYGLLRQQVAFLILRDVTAELEKRAKTVAVDGVTGAVASKTSSGDESSVTLEQLRTDPRESSGSPYDESSRAAVHELMAYLRKQTAEIDRLAIALISFVLADEERFIGSTSEPQEHQRKPKLENAEIADALGIDENKVSKVKKRIRDVCLIVGVDFHDFMRAIEGGAMLPAAGSTKKRM